MVLSPPFFSPLSSFLFFPPFISTFTYGTSSLHEEVAWMDVVQHRQMGQKELLVQSKKGETETISSARISLLLRFIAAVM